MVGESGEGAPAHQMGITTPPPPSSISLVLEKLADLIDLALGGERPVGGVVPRHPDCLPPLVATRVDLLDLLHAARRREGRCGVKGVRGMKGVRVRGCEGRAGRT